MKQSLLAIFLATTSAVAAPAEPPGYMSAAETERYLTERFQLDAPARRYSKDAPVHVKAWSEDEKAAQRQTYTDAKTKLDEAVAGKAESFTFPPGVYRFPGTGIIVKEATNLTIHAAGCEFICEAVDDKFDGFGFSGCANVTLQGPLVLDADVMPYFQGTLLSFSEPGVGAAELRVRPLPGYALRPTHLSREHRAAVFDPDSGELVSTGQWAGWLAESNADGTVTLRNPKWGGHAEALAVGRTIALEGTGSAFSFRSCKDMTIDGMDSFGGGIFFGFGIEGRFTVRNFRLIPRPGTNRLVANQVGQFDYRCDLTVEDSEFGMGWDDGINDMGKMGMVFRQVSPNQILAGRAPAPGSTLRFFSYDDFAPLGSAEVAACVPVTDATIKTEMRDNFAAFLAARKQTGNWFKHPSLVTFTADFAVPDNAILDEVCRDEPCTITVRRTVWRDQAAPAICIKGVKRGTIENNLFIRGAGSAVWVGFDFFWAEGPIPNHVAIRGNVFRGNPRGAAGKPQASISIEAGITDPTKNNAIMRDMVIEDNMIDAPITGGIFLGNVDGGSIRNNTIDFSTSAPAPLPQHFHAGAITVNACQDVVVENNRIICTSDFPNEILLLGNYDKDTVVVRNNTIASAPPLEQRASFDALLAFQQLQGRAGWTFQFAATGSQELHDMPTPYWWAGRERDLGKGYFATVGHRGGLLKARAGSQNDVVVTFVAPRSGKVRVDCDPILADGNSRGRMAILKNEANLWPGEGFTAIEPNTISSAHLEAEVARGDRLLFRVSGGTLLCRPVVTYADPGRNDHTP